MLVVGSAPSWLSDHNHWKFMLENLGGSVYRHHVDDFSPKCRWLEPPVLRNARATSAGFGRPSHTSMLGTGVHEDFLDAAIACNLVS